MAGKSLGTLTLDLVARTAGFTAGLSKAERESAKWKKQVSKNISDAAKTGVTATAAVAAGAATAVTMIVNKQRELIDQQSKTAQSLDTTYASMANLERAGGLAGVGIETVEKAGVKLAVNIGKAIQGSDAQVEAFKRLGLSAQELYDLPLDERIATINQALKDNVQASERAAVAAEIYGAKNALIITRLNPETIKEAARQAELFGTALSDIDASKVEAANDSFSVITLAVDGLEKQLTVQLAPAIDAIGKEFLQAAEDAGGFDNVVADAVGNAIEMMAFLINAVDGVSRAFDVVANSAIVAFTKIQTAIQASGIVALSAADLLPGIDYSKEIADAKDQLKVLQGIRDQAREARGNAITDPLAGEGFKKFWADAQKASEDAAAQAVKTRNEAIKTGEAFDDEAEAREKAAQKAADGAQKAQEAIAGEITALERAAATWGMSADEVKIYDLRIKGANESQLEHASALLKTVSALEEQKKATEEYQDIVKSLRTEEEMRTDTLLQQLAAIEAVNDAGAGDARNRAIDAAFPESPDATHIGKAASGPFSDLFDVNVQEQELEDWYTKQIEMLNTFRAERSDLSEQWNEKELEIKKQHEAAMQNLEMARWTAVASGVGNILASVSSMIETDSKKGKERAKKLAIAQATINAYTAFTGALASAASIPVLGWIMAPIAAAAALAAGMQQVNAIKGQAHDGIMEVPSSGTWNLEKGERVTTANTSAKLDETLERVQQSMSGSRQSSGGMGRNVTVNQTINTQGVIDNRTSAQIALDSQRRQRIAQARFA